MPFSKITIPCTLPTPSRFSEQLEFKDWAAKDCLDLLAKHSARDGIELSDEFHPSVLRGFDDLKGCDGWGNARDVNTIYDKMTASRELRADDEGDIYGGFLLEDIDSAFSAMMRQRGMSGGKQRQATCH